MPVAPAQPASPRGSVISGYPTPLLAVDAFIDDFVSIYTEAVVSALDWARTSFRSAALHIDGWRDLAPALDVEFDEGDFVYVVKGQEQYDRAMELEYGVGLEGPTAFIRKTASRQAPTLTKMMSDHLSKAVPVA